MTTPGRDWNEVHLVEDPAVDLLVSLGWRYVAPDTLDFERESYHEVILTRRLAAAVAKLNPGLSDENVKKAVRAVTTVAAASPMEANEKLHTAITFGISLEEEREDGRRSRSVRFVDFDHPRANDLVVTRQFKVKGTKKHIIPDIVLFVNGLPMVVIECKSPTLGEKWLLDAVEQLHRYQETTDGYRGLGAPKLFETAQVLVATCAEGCRYGTVRTPQRFFFDWKNPWPRTSEEIEAEIGKTFGRKPTPQDLLFHGLLTPEALLDVVRNFVAFDRDPKSGKTVRKLCRHQQYAAVNKAIERVRTARKPAERGGVVWHTQGSGKSLTMLWLATKLRRDPAHENPTIVIVTDRTDLDDQIAGTFAHCGFPNPIQAASVRHLKELLSGPTGVTVMTTVQKFQELTGASRNGGRRGDRKEYDRLSDARNIFVLADEAHRTQYGGLAANMRKALPNACFLGFTGTPIDKRDRSTMTTFGPYIDTYTIEQAVADGATVPIFYESRLPDLRIAGTSLDKLFDHVFADRSAEEREAIKSRYGNEAAIAGAPKRIEAIALDLIEHFEAYIRPNGFKAQIVAPTREAAATYKETLDRLNAPPSAILISGSNDDRENLVRHHTSEDDRKKLIARFLKEDDPLSILVVCDMLLTGFDAPVEQVMYLDSPLKEHTLLQAIARVNRPCGDQKSYGLVVDYWGVSENLQEALAIFSPKDVHGAMRPKGDELPRLQAHHAAAMKFFAKVKDKDDLDACVALLEPEDLRSDFEAAFRAFGQSLDRLLPDPKALPYVRDCKWLGKIRQTARARYHDSRIDISDCGEKVRKLIEEAIVAEGIEILVQKVSLFSKEFDEKVDAQKSDEAKASEMEHAIRAEIHVRIDENPAFYASLQERLEKIIEERKKRRIEAAKQLEELKRIIAELKDEAGAAEKLGLTETGFAIYGVLQQGAAAGRVGRPGARVGEGVPPYGSEESRKELASLIEEKVEPLVEIVDWVHKEDLQREIRKEIKRQLRAASFPAEGLDASAAVILDLLKARRGPR